jgi:hypothetical protein
VRNAPFKVGDEVILSRRGKFGGDIATTVTKVGRKYFWVADAHHYQKFHLDSGREVTQYGSPDCVTTPERRAEEVRRDELEEALRERGIRLDRPQKWDALTLTRIVAAIEQAGETA